jgi:hypothetical protein
VNTFLIVVVEAAWLSALIQHFFLFKKRKFSLPELEVEQISLRAPAPKSWDQAMSALTMVESAVFLAGFRLWDRFSEGNLIGSRTKKTG